MKFSVQRQELLSAINRVSGAVDRRSTLPVLSHVLIVVYLRGAVGVTATDLELFATAECGAEVPAAGGEACVPAKKIKDALDSIPVDTVELGIENMTMTIEGDGIRYSFSCLPADEFPTVPASGLKESLLFSPGLLPKMINACSHAADQTGHRATRYGGIHFCRENDRLTAVAIDGHRLSLVGMALDGVYQLEKSITLPLKTCKLLAGVVGNIEMSVENDRLAHFVSPGSSIYSAIFDGDYPDFRRVIATDYPHLTTVDRKRLIEALSACGVISDDGGKTVNMQIHAAGHLTVSALGDLGTAEAVIPCDGDDSLVISIPSRQLLQALKALEGDEVFLKYQDNLHPLLIFPADHGPWDERLEMIQAMRARKN